MAKRNEKRRKVDLKCWGAIDFNWLRPRIKKKVVKNILQKKTIYTKNDVFYTLHRDYEKRREWPTQKITTMILSSF